MAPMRILTFGIDNRALLEAEGHSKRWNARMGEYVELLDVFVEMRGGAPLAPKMIAPNVRILPLRVPHPLLYSWIACRAALREHARQRYDLVTAEDPFRPGLAAALFSRATRVPFNIEYHTACFDNPGWIGERPLINRAYDRIGKWVVRRARSIRCVNGKCLAQIRDICGGAPRQTLEVIPVPTMFYDPERHDAPAARLRDEITGGRPATVILFVGRLAPVKNTGELIAAFGELRERCPDALLVLVGDGPERPALEAQARAAGPGRILFRGYVPEAEVFPYYGAADLFANPAHAETYGRVYIEAMSAGIPAITRPGTGAVEDRLCVDGRTALVTPTDSVADLREALERLTLDAALRRRLGRAALATVRERFDYDSHLRRMAEFWKTSLIKSE